MEGFDLDLNKIVAQLLTNKRLTRLAGRADAELLIGVFSSSAQFAMTVMQLKANPRDQKGGKHKVLVIQRD